MTAPGDPFAGTEPHYAAHRPGYGDEPIDHLVSRFDLGADSRVLDLGCGTGQIALSLATHVGTVVAVDPNERMLEEGREAASAAGHENVRWVRGSDTDLPDGSFDLVAMGRSFHRMDGEATLRRLRERLHLGGGIALLSDPEWLTKGTEGWQEAVYDLVEQYLDDVPDRTGPVEYDEPWSETVEVAGLTDVRVEEFPFERSWTADGIVGYVFSLSFCSPERFGTETAAFESALRDRVDGQRPFPESGSIRVITGRESAG